MLNLARGRVTTVSSKLPDVGVFNSSNAVNGNSNSTPEIGGCLITAGHPTDNWWQVDLKAVYDVWEVVVTNVGHCCGMLDFLFKALLWIISYSTCACVRAWHMCAYVYACVYVRACMCVYVRMRLCIRACLCTFI